MQGHLAHETDILYRQHPIKNQSTSRATDAKKLQMSYEIGIVLGTKDVPSSVRSETRDHYWRVGHIQKGLSEPGYYGIDPTVVWDRSVCNAHRQLMKFEPLPALRYLD